MKLTLFYDGSCPLCVAEMQSLARYDVAGRLDLVDLFEPDFNERFPHINVARAMKILHGELSREGRGSELLLGLDATYWAWRLVGKKPWVAILRWPVVKWFADAVYLFFARYRYPISALFTGSRRCSSGTCSTQNNKE